MWTARKPIDTVVFLVSAFGYDTTDTDFSLRIIKNSSVIMETESADIFPQKFQLFSPYPNPFNPTTQIQYELPKAGEVNITVYNTLGVEVMEIDKGFRSAGIHKVTFNGNDLPSGIYFYQLKVGSIVKTRKMSLIK